jgi:hypothetical protein
MGKTYLTFIVNAVRRSSTTFHFYTLIYHIQAVAVVGFIVLLFSRFPPEGSTRHDDKQNDEGLHTA